MYENKKFLAIIPARAGSKRLQNKNLLKLNNKPLIGWTIEAGLKSKYIDEVMVTTDDDNIMQISESCGANVPFKRPKELATDYATRSQVINHTINYYKNIKKKHFDYLIFLQPTSPLRDEIDIDKAIEFMCKKNADAIISVCEVEHPIQWSGTIPGNKDMTNFLNNSFLQTRSQDLEKYYRLNGAIYICSIEKFLEEECVFLRNNIFAFEMSQIKSVDIDTKIDFLYASFLMDNKSDFLRQ
ncbi:acylneuraminate cytidylyltransferase family protein [Halarcobacter sp.]|uniref:acylneuraminate cytidylyltransferase family protein n=1 Tax=Halarcobacter sp. TaxID=2321133 RepID=UPI0029F5A8E7|nr:acylneuraminate cytidylyltransferase family protein [Halarcobacter sp.]